MKRLYELIQLNGSHKSKAVTSINFSGYNERMAFFHPGAQKNKWMSIKVITHRVNPFSAYSRTEPNGFIAYGFTLFDQPNLKRAQVYYDDYLRLRACHNKNIKNMIKKVKKVPKAYVDTNLNSIHLDCFGACQREEAQGRNAFKALPVCESTIVCKRATHDPSPFNYVTSAEVSRADGTKNPHDQVSIVPAHTTKNIIIRHKQFFGDKVLQASFEQRVAQPSLQSNVDFIGHIDCNSLSDPKYALSHDPLWEFDTHFTHYQDGNIFFQSAKRLFALLKIGSALTFAYRRAIDALCMFLGVQFSYLSLQKSIKQMIGVIPFYWQSYYHTAKYKIKTLMAFSFRACIRSHWNQPQTAVTVKGNEQVFNRYSSEKRSLHQYFREDIFAPLKKFMYGYDYTQQISSKNRHKLRFYRIEPLPPL